MEASEEAESVPPSRSGEVVTVFQCSSQELSEAQHSSDSMSHVSQAVCGALMHSFAHSFFLPPPPCPSARLPAACKGAFAAFHMASPSPENKSFPVHYTVSVIGEWGQDLSFAITARPSTHHLLPEMPPFLMPTPLKASPQCLSGPPLLMPLLQHR